MIAVTHVVGTGNVGGTERQLLLLLDEIGAGFHHEILTLRGGPFVDEFARRAPTRVIGKRPGADARAVVRLARTLRAARPDIITTWGTTATITGVPAAGAARVPRMVATVRDVPVRTRGVRTIAWRVAANRADAIVANCSAAAASAAARGARPELVRVIANGVRMPAPAHGIVRDLDLVLYVGRLDPVKGVDVLLDAVPRLLATRPGTRLALVGGAALPSERRYADALRTRVAALGVAAAVRFVGQIGDPSALLSRAGVVAVPSRAEALPNVVLEAMALGAPLVATAVGGVPELLRSGETGLLVPPEDPVRLGDALANVLSNPEAAHDRAVAAQQVAATRFTPARMAGAWRRLWEDLVA